MLRHVTPHNQNAIAVFPIDIVVRHGTASTRLSRAAYRGAVSDPGLMIDIDHAQSASLGGNEQHSSLSMWSCHSDHVFTTIDEFIPWRFRDKFPISRGLSPGGDS